MDKFFLLFKIFSGRKNYIIIEFFGVIFIYGGEIFDGRSREFVGEMFIFFRKFSFIFYRVGVLEVKRVGYVCGVVEDKIIFYGGFGGKNYVYGDIIYMFCFFDF